MVCSVCSTPNGTGASSCSACGASLIGSTTGGGGTGVSARGSQVLPPGTKLLDGRYAVGKVLGQGGFGITYQGADVSVRSTVAVKEFFPSGSLRQGCTVDPGAALPLPAYQDSKARFLDEAQTLARFDHPNIVRVYSAFEENNTAYMVMDFLQGGSLADLLEASGGISEQTAIGYVVDIASALAHIHESKMLHRDLKPDNIMIRGDHAILIDFGTAREFAAGKTSRMTQLLTPGYAPYEQYVTKARFGPYTDIYALGATLYHALTGQPPPPAPDRAHGVETGAPHQLNPKVSRVVSDAVMWALQPKAEMRPQCVGEFLQALQGKVTPPTPRAQTLATTGARPFKFQSGEASTLAELVDLCDRFPLEAQEYLSNAYFERWLVASMGEAALARTAAGYASGGKDEKRLELFVREVCKKAGIPPYPRLEARPASLDGGELPMGAVHTVDLQLRNSGRGQAWGKVRVDPPLEGVEVPPTFESAMSQIAIRLETLQLAAGKHSTEVVVEAEQVPDVLRVPLTFTVTPLQVRLEPPHIDLGRVTFGSRTDSSIQVSVPAGGRLTGTIAIDPPLKGVSLDGRLDGQQSTLKLQVDTSQLAPGRDYNTCAELRTNAGRFQAPVRFQTGRQVVVPILARHVLLGGVLGLATLLLLRVALAIVLLPRHLGPPPVPGLFGVLPTIGLQGIPLLDAVLMIRAIPVNLECFGFVCVAMLVAIVGTMLVTAVGKEGQPSLAIGCGVMAVPMGLVLWGKLWLIGMFVWNTTALVDGFLRPLGLGVLPPVGLTRMEALFHWAVAGLFLGIAVGAGKSLRFMLHREHRVAVVGGILCVAIVGMLIHKSGEKMAAACAQRGRVVVLRAVTRGYGNSNPQDVFSTRDRGVFWSVKVNNETPGVPHSHKLTISLFRPDGKQYGTLGGTLRVAAWEDLSKKDLPRDIDPENANGFRIKGKDPARYPGKYTWVVYVDGTPVYKTYFRIQR